MRFIRSRCILHYMLPRYSRVIGLAPTSAIPACTSSFTTSQTISTLSPRVQELMHGMMLKKRIALSQAITLVESTKPQHKEDAEILLDHLLALKQANNGDENGQEGIKETARPQSWVSSSLTSFRIGIAGPPGSGKSTFIESLGLYLTKMGHHVAVLAIDPSSSVTKGSILGDKTRMNVLSNHPNAFVRPSPTRGTLGGVAQHTNDIVLLCEAFGYDIILVESVGLGQSEVVIDETVDMVVLLVPPGGGDELQGSKKGIMEVADIVLVNKADGKLLSTAKHTSIEYKRAVQFMRSKTSYWTTKVQLCSALEGTGIESTWEVISEYRKIMAEKDQICMKREKQSTKWMWNQLQEELAEMVRRDQTLATLADQLREDLVKGNICPRSAAKVLLQKFLAHSASAHAPPQL